MARRIVILGAGTGGTALANRLRRMFGEADARITVIDRDDRHVYQPGLLFVPFGLASPTRIVRPRHRYLRRGIEFRVAEVERVALERRQVELAGGDRVPYDVLVVASGARLQPEETEGLTGPGRGDRLFGFYDLPDAMQLARGLERFEGGRIVVDVVDMPVKCPVAPLEFCFLADWHLRLRGIRDRVEIALATPLDGAFTKPVASAHLGGLLAEKGIELVTEFAAGEVDGERGVLTSYDGREERFDMLVAVPAHGGAGYVERSDGLGDPLGFVPTDLGTLQSHVAENVFALGDATDLPVSKAGSVTHFESEVLAGNIRRALDGRELESGYDGHANCFVETGFGRALLVDFNDEVEPLPGRFPGRLGPMPLLRESRLDHFGKLAFQQLYWHLILPGRSIPGVPPRMTTAGKQLPARVPEYAEETS